MAWLDPKSDLVFKLLLVREPVLLHDMLEAVLGRSIQHVRVTNPEIFGDRPAGKRVIFDVHAVLDDGSRADLEMQRRTSATLAARLTYYAARDHATQLRRGEGYDQLTPTYGIIWLVEPLALCHDRFHSVFELRDQHTGARLTDQLALHVLQLSCVPANPAPGPRARIERWARFLAAPSRAELDQLASEAPIMAHAKQTLEQLSQDPEVLRQIRKQEDDQWFYRLEIAASGAEGGARVLSRLLVLRFGPLSDEVRERIQFAVASARSELIERWAERVLTAASLDEVFAD